MSIIDSVEAEVHRLLSGEHTGHDWHHTQRVRNLALSIARDEGADLEIVDLAALFHDVDDYKFSGDHEAGYRFAKAFLAGQGYPAERAEHVASIVHDLGFKGAGVDDTMPTIEGACVQDADRMDAIGAIGIARAFSYGGHMGQMIYDPGERIEQHASFEEYRERSVSSIGHFSEKLLLLKDRMKTETGKRIAEQRHAFMVRYLDQFHAEWNGNG